MASSEKIKLTFLGTGTSQGVPVITCECGVCTSDDPKDKRLRTSAMIEVGGVTLVIDSGPDFRQQMLRERVMNLDAVLYSHAHKDHIAGMDDVRAFNYRAKKPMEVFCSEEVYQNLCREFHYVFDPMFQYPGIPKVNATIIGNQPFVVKGVEIIPIEVMHYKLPVHGFRIGDLAYITDANHIADEELEKLKGLDILVLNALRKEQHISHFNLHEALEVIEQLKPKKAYLTHISHYMGLHNEVNIELPDGVEIAWDGLVVEC